MMRSVRIGLVAAVMVSSAACGLQLGPPSDPAATHDIPPFSIPPVQPGVAYERFMAIGDMGTGRPDQRKVAEAMTTKAKGDGLDFIITVGDNIYQGGVDSVVDPQWKSKFEDVYADPTLQVPIHPTLGNHDYRGNVQAQIDYSRHCKRWTMPTAFYTFTRTLADGTKVQFFAIDSTPIHRRKAAADAQIAWLDEELGRSDARWKIVFGHHPLFSNGEHGSDAEMIAKLEPLFTKHDVDLYLAGHDHTLEMLRPIKGVHYVVTGAAAGADKAYHVRWTDQSYYAATLGGFTYLRVSSNELVIEFVRMNGVTQYAHVLSK